MVTWFSITILAGLLMVENPCPEVENFHNALPQWQQDHSVLDLVNLTGNLFVQVRITIDGDGNTDREAVTDVMCGKPWTAAALPGDCAQFAGWSGDVSGTQNPISLVATTDITLTAHFQPRTVQVEILAAEGGSTDMAGLQTLTCGESLTVNVQEDACYRFTGWSDPALGDANPLVLEPITSDLLLSPQFEMKTFQVEILTGDGGVTDLDGISSVTCGQDLIVTAKNDACYRFTGWSDPALGDENPLLLAGIEADTALQPLFEAITNVSVTVTSDTGGSTSVSGTQTLPCGETLIVWADRTEVAEFSGWSGDASGGGNPLMLELSGPDLQVHANYQLAEDVSISSPRIAGTVAGLATGSTARVTLGGKGLLESVQTAADGAYAFDGVPEGVYFLKVEALGYDAGAAQRILVQTDGTRSTQPPIDPAVAQFEPGHFVFHWENDASISGYQLSAHVNQPVEIVFLDEPVAITDDSAALSLLHKYHIILSNEEEAWDGEHAYRLKKMMEIIPQPTRGRQFEHQVRPSKWILTDELLVHDIEMQDDPAGRTVRISKRAFVYAQPRLALVDGQRGRFFSKRLHHAVVRFVTDDGEDQTAVEAILQRRFALSGNIPDYAALTQWTTGEDQYHFQQFKPLERVALINAMEEMPTGFHKTPGFDFLVRRLAGHPHPIYPQAPAVAWPGYGYVEFMDDAFAAGFTSYSHRLILHEKAHFMWANLFSETLRQEWIELGCWTQQNGGWTTCQTTQFVSAYAHAHNPNEDMAESIASFVFEPELIRSRAPDKYAFIKNRIMHGTRYISQIDPQFTFEVLNLYPDYDYPGKIIGVHIEVEGEADQDKLITVDLRLNQVPGYFDGAAYAYTRLYSEVGTYRDLYLHPVNGDGFHLRGALSLSKFAKSGYWRAPQITVTDQVGNQRFEGQNDFEWKLFVDNALEDLEAPQYVPDSLEVSTTPTSDNQGRAYHLLEISWLATDNLPGLPLTTYSRVVNAEASQYYLEAYGSYDPDTLQAKVIMPVTEFRAPGDYCPMWLSMVDLAGNPSGVLFSDSPNDPDPVCATIMTADPDNQPPEIDLNSVQIAASPTNPTNPNGETLVSLQFNLRDDKSGVGLVYYRLLDPQGIVHGEYLYHENFSNLFFEGDPSTWKTYQAQAVLPVGSPPGIWGLSEILAVDKAGNNLSQSFVEIIQFQVE